MTHDLTVERTAFLIRVGFYLLFFALLALCNLVFDMAKVRLVVEDRRNVLARRLSRRSTSRRRTAAWCSAPTAPTSSRLALVVAAHAAVAPGVGGAGAAMWVTFIVGQVYIAARLREAGVLGERHRRTSVASGLRRLQRCAPCRIQRLRCRVLRRWPIRSAD